MAKKRKMVRRRGRPRVLGPKVTAGGLSVVPSLPPAPPEPAPQTAPSPEEWTDQDNMPPEGHPARAWWLPSNSKVRTTAMQIIAMRISGMEDDQIAAELKISKNSISPYVYRATKNGWLDITYDPKARLQLQTMHKVVQRLEEGLDSKGTLNTGMKERTHVALKMAEGTLFKQFNEAQTAPLAQAVVAIRIEMPAGPQQTIREETTGGTPAFIDAEVV